MSVATEGVEETLFEGTRETRQTTKITQICAKIDQLLEQAQKDDVVEINLPDELGMNNAGARVLEAIHSIYSADRIGNDLFIKYDGLNKERIHYKLVNSAETMWYSASNGICVVGGAERRPDVGVWFTRPTQAQRTHPIINQCPPPAVWIEVFFDKDPDRSNAFNRINYCQQYWNSIEYVGIAIPETIHQNPNPWQASTAVVRQNNRPNQSPYVIHWDRNNNPMYFKYSWNNHLVLRDYNLDHPDTCDNCESLFSFFDQLKDQLGLEFNDMLDNYQIKLIS
ncbi:13676_t:CDS:2 [Funneliformis caledonium]|uniref:13676_t:CDS:1 n=1 Tax=Funneliformis caledonium TaxID=1117310 RepID=A0A9N9CX44_9GLOM|nr:13676_t:CDS:2 [Funneliformis caledonium]